MISGAQNALVLAPHPDDETLGCGGTIRLIAQAGGAVDVAFLTHGEIGNETSARSGSVAEQALARRRADEAAEACRILGVRNVRFLPGHDGRLHLETELSRHILAVLREGQYRSVFCPWENDAHSDHRAAHQLFKRALAEYDEDLDVWLYEVWTPLPVTMAIPIDTSIEQKLQAIGAYRSQLGVVDYLTAFRALAEYRSLFCASSRYAEAFMLRDRDTLLNTPQQPAVAGVGGGGWFS